VEPHDECETALRTLGLLSDLGQIAAELDETHWTSLMVTRAAGHPRISVSGPGENAVPLLAAALLQELERLVACGEAVRGRLPARWRRVLVEGQSP
jgi:hypothetical protein